MTPAGLKSLFESMLSDVGGEANPDVNWYLNERPQTITRDSFFRAMVWAVWAAGKSRVGNISTELTHSDSMPISFQHD